MFTLTIETDNAAFEGDPSSEIARILGRLVSKLALDPHEEDGGKLFDVNGNTVGTWTYTPSED